MKNGGAGDPEIPGGRDRVIVSGSILIFFSLLLLPFLSVRETRISPAEGISALKALGPVPLASIAALVAAAVFSAGFRSRSRRTIASASLSRMLVLLILWQAGSSAARLSGTEMPFARISIGSGAWIALLGAFMIMSSCRAAAREHRRFIPFCWAFYAALIYLFLSGDLDSLSFMVEYFNRSGRFRQELIRHITLAFSAVGLGILAGFPLGLKAYRNKRLRTAIISTANTVQTIPSLALFGLMIAPLAWAARSFPTLASLGIGGIGWAPALIALAIYSLLPIIKNTISAFSVIDNSVVDSGRGMGMSRNQLFFRVELPMAMPVIVTGIRISGVQAIGNTAVAALIGAGGLGQFIFQGLGEAAPDLILLGALPTVLLALIADGGFKRIADMFRPGGTK